MRGTAISQIKPTATSQVLQANLIPLKHIELLRVYLEIDDSAVHDSDRPESFNSILVKNAQRPSQRKKSIFDQESVKLQPVIRTSGTVFSLVHQS